MSQTLFIYSIAMICPAAFREKANLLSCALGHDELPGNTFAVPLSADGSKPATHYGTLTTAQQSFVDTLAGASQGELPPVTWGDYGLTVEDVMEVLGALVVDIKPALTEGQFGTLCDTLGLSRIIVPTW